MTPLRRDRRAASAVEFAIVLPVLLLAFGGLADTGLLVYSAARLAAGVSAAAEHARLAGSTVVAANVQAIVQQASGLTPVTVTVPAPSCACVSTAALVTQACNATCSDGAAPGTYLAITARFTYQPMLPLVSRIVETTLTDEARVRLQ